MTRLSRALVLAGLAALLPLGPVRSDSDPLTASAVPAFAGRYRLVLTPDTSCPAAVRVGTLSVLVDVVETSVRAVAETAGVSATPGEVPDDGRFVLLRQGDKLHGASGSTNAALGLRTLEGYRVWMQIMADGTANTASGGRARASGTAFGEIDIARPGDPDADTIGACVFAAAHTWALEPA